MGLPSMRLPPIAGWFLLENPSILMDEKNGYPLVNIQKAIENGPVETVDFPIQNGGSFHSYVKLPESILIVLQSRYV